MTLKHWCDLHVGIFCQEVETFLQLSGATLWCEKFLVFVNFFSSSVDNFGAITAVSIQNHGSGFLSRPSLVLNDSSCLCGLKVMLCLWLFLTNIHVAAHSLL